MSPPKQSQNRGAPKRSLGAPRSGGGAGRDRDNMSSQKSTATDPDDYHNLPEISWNTEPFNFDAGDFTSQDASSVTISNAMSINDQLANASSLQHASDEQPATMCRHSPPKKVLRPCSHCGKTFSRTYDLNRHESSHSDIRRFACEYPGCNKRYKLRQDLKAHERNAHEGRGGGGAVVIGHWRGYEDRLYSM